MNGVQNKFLANDVVTLFSGKDLIIISETHFGIRVKCPEGYILIGRSIPRESKKLRGGVAVYQKFDSTMTLNIICDTLYDMIAVEIENTSTVLVAAYIPPDNSIYYTDIYFENLRLLIHTYVDNKDLYILGDLNSRVGNVFPSQGFAYRINPDGHCNQNGRYLLNILKEFKDMNIVNGIIYKNRSMDSKLTLVRKSGASQVDMAISNNINSIYSFKISDKIPQSDHCPFTIEIKLDFEPSITTIDECACGFKEYGHLDIDKRIRNPIKISKLNLVTLDNDLIALGERISNKYRSKHPSEENINSFTNDVTIGIYNCCIDNYIENQHDLRIPIQQNCNSDNYKAIAEAHRKRYLDLHGTNFNLSAHHKEEWLYYQSIAWQEEQKEINKYKNEKWCAYNQQDPKKLWKMLDWKGELKTKTASGPNIIHAYFDKNIFNSIKTKENPILEEIKEEVECYSRTNEISDKRFDHSDLKNAISDIGKGISFDGLPGQVLQLMPANLKDCILHLFRTIFSHKYPSQWRNQLLFSIEKKGHQVSNPKLRGIAVGPLLSRLYDIMLNQRFCSWYFPNPEQAGFRRQQGCIVQIFALLLTLAMAKSLQKSLFIGLLDFEKAFDYMNRPTLMKDLMKKGIGDMCLKSLNNMYNEVNYSPKISNKMVGEAITTDHGVTQGRNSSCNIFSFYISDMCEPLKKQNDCIDFTEPENILQLADDTVILAEQEGSLVEKFAEIFKYTEKKYITINMDKTKYMNLTENPSLNDLKIGNTSIEAVSHSDGYNWLGFNLSYSSEVK